MTGAAAASAPHTHPIHVYYEDTDLAGIVYYANYLKYIERARTEYIRTLGVDQSALKAEHGVVFAVARIEADYLSPAKFDDDLIVHTTPVKLTPARVVLSQDVLRGTTTLFRAVVTLAALTETGRPTRIPRLLTHKMQ